jgi:hypothetical protein
MPFVKAKAEDSATETEVRESHATAFRKVKVEIQWVSRGTVTDVVK